MWFRDCVMDGLEEERSMINCCVSGRWNLEVRRTSWSLSPLPPLVPMNRSHCSFSARRITGPAGLTGMKRSSSVSLAPWLIFMRTWDDEVEERGGRRVWCEKWMWECVCNKGLFWDSQRNVLAWINLNCREIIRCVHHGTKVSLSSLSVDRTSHPKGQPGSSSFFSSKKNSLDEGWTW